MFEGLLSAEMAEDGSDREPHAEETPDEGEAAAVDPESEGDESEPVETPEEGDEPADDARDEEESEDEEAAPPADPESAVAFTVEEDGMPKPITVGEAKKGYLRQSDYTRKTQALAESRKALEAEVQQSTAVRETYAARLAAVEEALSASAPKAPDWETLRQQDPARFAEEFAAYQLHEQRAQVVKAERERVEQELQETYKRDFTSRVASETEKLFAALPKWQDAAVRTKEKQALVDYAKGMGYSDAEINAVTDHRVLVMLYKAMTHDTAEKARPVVERQVKDKVQKTIERVKAATPGPASAAKRVVSQETRLKQRLAKTGRAEDAAAAILQMGIVT